MYSFKINRNCLYLIGDNINTIAKKYLEHVPQDSIKNHTQTHGASYHITITTPLEKSILKTIELEKLEMINDILDLGLGMTNGSYYVLIFSQKLSDLRKKYSLPKINFHITLGYNNNDDVHDKPKNIETIIIPNFTDDNIKKINVTDQELEYIEMLCIKHKLNMNIQSELYLKKLGNMFKNNKFDEGLNYCDELLNMKDQKYKIQLLSKRMAIYNKLNKLEDAYIDIMNILESISIEDEILKSNLMTIKNDLLEKITSTIKADDLYNMFLDHDKSVKLPRYTSWIIPGYLMASSIPKRREQIELFKLYNIKKIYTIMKEEKIDPSIINDINVQQIMAENYEPPLLSEIIEMVDEIEYSLRKGEGVLVHCGGGKGRTGVALACHIVKNGLDRIHNDDTPKMYPAQAIELLRKTRSKSLESKQQEDMVSEYYHYLIKESSKSKVGTNIIPLKKSPELMILVGLPGSGKSTFVSHLVDHFYVISQDQMSKSECEQAIGKLIKKGPVIIDNCNITIKDRYFWWNLAFKPKNTLIVYFDIDVVICKKRVTQRIDHPTISFGSGENIVECFYKKLEPICPSQESYFKDIVIIKSTQDVNNLLKYRFNLDVEQHDNFIKFPKTPHLFDLGNVQSDDILVDEKTCDYFIKNCNVTIEEKIDGSNLGISMEDYKFVIKNRSHIIKTNEHQQYSKLEQWIGDHYEDLYKILEKHQCRYILYGEWLQATHTINYTKLSDYFIAYDIFDKLENKFYSRKKFRSIMEKTNIKVIPMMYHGVIESKNFMLKLMDSSSNFDDSKKIEGLYF